MDSGTRWLGNHRIGSKLNTNNSDLKSPLSANAIRFTGYFEKDNHHFIEHWNKGVASYDSLVDLFRHGRHFFAQGEMWLLGSTYQLIHF